MEGYSTTLKSMSLLYLELKKAARLLIQGFNYDQIKEKALEENIFMVNTENRIKEIAATIISRVKILDEVLLKKLNNGSLETSKQIALYTILKTDRLFFDFMREVYREKCLFKDYVITDRDFNTFFRRKAEQSEKVASWKNYTYYKLKQVYKRILVEAGFAKKNNKELQIIRPIIEQELAEHLKNKGDQIYLSIMMGEH